MVVSVLFPSSIPSTRPRQVWTPANPRSVPHIPRRGASQEDTPMPFSLVCLYDSREAEGSQPLALIYPLRGQI